MPRLTAALGPRVADRQARERLGAALRKGTRAHIHRLLRELTLHGGLAPAVGVLHPPRGAIGLPLVALYFPPGRRREVLEAARGRLEVVLQKSDCGHRLGVVNPQRGRLLTSSSFVDEAVSAPFRRGLAESGGRFQVALVELETLEVAELRTMHGYLDFTGAFHRGLEKLAARDLTGAVRELELSLAANPRLAGAQAAIGICYRKLAKSRHDLARAAERFEKELELDPRAPEALYHLGVLGLAAGRLEEAIGRFEAAVRADPWHLGALTHLATALTALPRRPGGREALRRVLARLTALEPRSAAVERLVKEASAAHGEDLAAWLHQAPLPGPYEPEA